MTVAVELERPCTPRKRLELAKEVDRESAVLLAKDAPSPTSVSATSSPTNTSAAEVETPRGGLRDFCETFVGTVVRQASRRLG